MNIHAFTNRQLCEYKSIFPTVAALLDHLLFTIGNGFYFIPDTGMIVDGNNLRIDEYPELSDVDWDKLIAECHIKERQFAERFADGADIDKNRLANACALYKRQAVDDSMFSTEALYKDLCVMRAERSNRRYGCSWVRPYPFSRGYSDIYNLNEKTPKWFIQIALNFCNAWVQFLNEEIENNNVWIKPSLRPKDPANPVLDKLLKEVIDQVLGNDGSEYTPEPEPESDYADLPYTVEYRDKLVAIVQKLETML